MSHFHSNTEAGFEMNEHNEEGNEMTQRKLRLSVAGRPGHLRLADRPFHNDKELVNRDVVHHCQWPVLTRWSVTSTMSFSPSHLPLRNAFHFRNVTSCSGLFVMPWRVLLSMVKSSKEVPDASVARKTRLTRSRFSELNTSAPSWNPTKNAFGEQLL